MTKDFAHQHSADQGAFEPHHIETSPVPQQIVRFSTRLELPEDARTKSRRRRTPPEPETPRVKTEAELREDAAWKQVEETGKPVVLDDCLLIPNGMSIWKAMEFLPDGVREPMEAGLEATLAEWFHGVLNRTEQEMRKKAEEDGKLEWYDSLPRYAKLALAESIFRAQWKMPEVPLPDLIRRWQYPEKDIEYIPKPKPRTKRTNKAAVLSSPSHPEPSLPPKTPDPTPPVTPTVADPIGVPSKPAKSTSHTTTPSLLDSALEWNRRRHRFLLKRLDQIWGYLDAEEQEAVRALLKRKLGKEAIEQIDEIVKGVEWVRRFQK